MQSTPRRGFLGRLLGSLAGLAVAPSVLHASQAQSPDESWLQGLNGKHRQILDVASTRGGTPLVRTANLLDAYAEAYGTKDSDVNAIFGVHSGALVIALNDMLWAKYELGKRANELDPRTQTPYTRNPFASGSPTSVARLQERGVRFIACGRAIRRLAGELATASGAPADQIRTEIHANLLPGVIAVPALIVAVNRAQVSGLTYVALG
jgi:intracellular sulfur oxidation DsrE/DsrF family protein